MDDRPLAKVRQETVRSLFVGGERCRLYGLRLVELVDELFEGERELCCARFCQAVLGYVLAQFPINRGKPVRCFGVDSRV